MVTSPNLRLFWHFCIMSHFLRLLMPKTDIVQNYWQAPRFKDLTILTLIFWLTFTSSDIFWNLVQWKIVSSNRVEIKWLYCQHLCTTLFISECMIDVKTIIIQSKGNKPKVWVQKPRANETLECNLSHFKKLLAFKSLVYYNVFDIKFRMRIILQCTKLDKNQRFLGKWILLSSKVSKN